MPGNRKGSRIRGMMKAAALASSEGVGRFLVQQPGRPQGDAPTMTTG